jgi:formamidopyrimidine-DNA glycosylase
MTGKWVLARPVDATLKFEKVRFDVSAARKKRSVRYLDPRLFGRFVVAAKKDADLPAWSALGPDPLLDGIDVGALQAKLATRKLAIQATEALFDARIDPRRPARGLSRKEVSALARAISRSIAKTIALQDGPTIQYVEEAGAPNPFLVYGNEGTPCPRCKRPLAKMVLGGRGTVFCPHCQR